MTELNQHKIEEIDVKELIVKILNKWYIFIISGIICICFAFYYIFSTPPTYSTTGTVLIRSENAMDKLNGDFSMAVDLLNAGKLVDDEVIILKSKSITKLMVEELNLQTKSFYKKKFGGYYELYNNEPITIIFPNDLKKRIQGLFTIRIKKNKNNEWKINFIQEIGLSKKRYKINTKSILDPIKTPWGNFIFIENHKYIDKKYPNYNLIYETIPIHNRIEQYNQLINVSLSNKKANAINININGGNIRKNETIINKIIELYNRDALLDKNKTSLQMADFISNRIKILNDELKIVEKNVEDYRIKNNIADITEQSKIAIKSLSDYDKILAEIDMQYSLLSFVENFVQNSEDLELIPSNTGIEDGSLSQLIIDYNSQVMEYIRLERSTNKLNPFISQLKNKISLTKNNIIQTITNVKKGTLIKKQDIIQKSNKIAKEINNVPTIEREYVEIGREQIVKRELYLFLLQKREEVQLTLAATTNSGKTVDNAFTQGAPISPNKKIIVLFSIFLSIIFSLLYIYIYYLINNKIENKKDLKSLTKIPILSSVPNVKDKKSNIVMIKGENNIISDAFRNLRINLKFTKKKESDKIILITSSHSGEGKSFISTNLAISLAMIDKKVALIGLDIRLPRLAEYIGLNRTPGVTDYISEPSYNESDICQVYSENSNLNVYVAGSIPPNPSEMLTNPRLSNLFEYLRNKYDYVIIDSAPIGLTSDTMQIAQYSDTILYVCRQKVTQKQYIQNLNSLVEDGHIKNVSLVLNGADASQGYGYGYGYGQKAHKKA